MDLLALAPGAVGIALSPLPVASVVFLLGHRRGAAPAIACSAGWVVAVAGALVLSVVVGERLPLQTAGGSSVQAIVALVAGIVLAGLAVWQWLVRRLPDGAPSSTRWSDPLDGGLAFGDAEPGAAEAVLAGAAFVVVAASTTVLPVALVLVTGRRARRPLAALRAGIARWGSAGLVAVLAVLAAIQLAVGVTGLS